MYILDKSIWLICDLLINVYIIQINMIDLWFIDLYVYIIQINMIDLWFIDYYVTLSIIQINMIDLWFNCLLY